LGRSAIRFERMTSWRSATDHAPGDLAGDRAGRELLEFRLRAGGLRDAAQDIEAAHAGLPRADVHPAEQDAVDHGYRNGLARRDRQLGVQLAERSAEAIEILRRPPRADVEIVGLADRSVVQSGDAADDHVLDLVSGERVDQRERLERIGQRVSRPVRSVPAHKR
jgi:hypothetical protein